MKSEILLGVVFGEVEVGPLLQFLEEEGVSIFWRFVARKADIVSDVYGYFGDTFRKCFELRKEITEFKV